MGTTELKAFFRDWAKPETPALGIGPKLNAEMDLANHVLSKFSPDEQATLEHHSLFFMDALKSLMTEAVDKAMNLYNQSLPTKI